jgi:hypothetical protein
MKLMNCSSSNYNTLYTLSGEYEYDITPYLINSVDWNSIFSTILSLKSDFNQLMMRFVKSQIICMTFERFSGKKWKYVDQIGHDFMLTDLGIKLEVKTGIKIFNSKTQKTVTIKVCNTNNQSSHTKKFQKTFDYMLMVEPGMAGIISWEKLEPYVESVGDGFVAKIDMSDVEIIKQVTSIKDMNINVPNLIDDAMNGMLTVIEEGLNE